jgi:hypothetical protein
LPDAHAIIDSKLKYSTYPYIELSGAGIALKGTHCTLYENW